MRRFAAAALAGTMVWGLAAALEAPKRPPVSAFAVLPNNAPSISPDGKYFAYVTDSNGRPAVAITEINSGKPPAVIASSELVISGILWAKPDVLLIYSRINKDVGVWDDKGRTFTLVNATAVHMGDYKQVTLTGYADVVDIDLDDPDSIFAAWDRDGRTAVIKMNVRTGASGTVAAMGASPASTGAGGDSWRFGTGAVVKRGPMNGTSSWYMDGHGHVVARLDFQYELPREEPHGIMQLKLREGGTWRTVSTYPFTVDTGDGLLGLAAGATEMIRFGQDANGISTIRRVSLADGKETEILKDPVYDTGEVYFNAWTGAVEGVSIIRERPEQIFFDPKIDGLRKGLAAALPGLNVSISSADVTWNRVIVKAEGPKSPASFYLLDRSTHQMSAIAASYPALDETMLGTVKSFTYKARDGLEIHGFLTLPPGKEAKNLPMVVLPHGGPAARDYEQFDWWAQFLANRGYAVLQPNFRGSLGYGLKFLQAGRKQWGLKMQDDVTDAVKKMIADGVADPKRICIVGGSYGGYAALAGAAFTPDLYACAASYAGVSDLPNIIGYDKNQNNGHLGDNDFNAAYIGDPFKDIDQLKATSPALHADKIDIPVLLLHSELDNTVPIAQSEEMAQALSQAGKTARFVRIKGDDHHLSVALTREVVLQELENFLKANIGN